MFKKIIALSLTLALLAPIGAVQAADHEASTPTLEEILNEYHQKAFQEQATGISLCSDGKTLEEETVEALNNAGYEAYIISSNNYDEIKELAQTDLNALGLDRDNRFIVTVNSNPGVYNSYSSSSKVVELPHYDYDIGVEDGSTYVMYNGVRYFYRYITITPDVNTHLRTISEYDLTYSPDLGDVFLDSVGIAISTTVDSWVKFPVSSIGSVLYNFYHTLKSDGYTAIDPDKYVMSATSCWTRQFVQIWNEEIEAWVNAQSSAYAVSAVRFTSYCYSINSGAIEPVDTDLIFSTTYSPFYNNVSQQIIDAIDSYIASQCMYDCTGDIKFYYIDDNVLIGENGQAEPLFTHSEKMIYNPREEN